MDWKFAARVVACCDRCRLRFAHIEAVLDCGGLGDALSTHRPQPPQGRKPVLGDPGVRDEWGTARLWASEVLKSSGCGGLLLGHAVEGAEAPDQIDGVDADDIAIREERGEGVEGDAVVWIMEGGHEDEAVGNVEIGVAGGQALAAEDDWPGHRQLGDGVLLPFPGARGLETGEIFGEYFVVGVAGVGFDGGEDCVGRDKAGDVVDVAVGVVADDAAVEPQDVVDTKVVVENGFQLLLAHAGVALLDFTEEAFLRGEENACAIGVNGAAFQYYAARPAVLAFRGGFGRVRWLPRGDLEQLCHAGGKLVVVVPVVVFGPGVEAPVGEGDLALLVSDEDGAGVAGPDTVGGPEVELDAVEIGAGAGEATGGAGALGGTGNDEVDDFARGEEADDFRVEPGDGLEFTGPVLAVVRPGEPCGLVRLPLGGHAVAELCGGLVGCGHGLCLRFPRGLKPRNILLNIPYGLKPVPFKKKGGWMARLKPCRCYKAPVSGFFQRAMK